MNKRTGTHSELFYHFVWTTKNRAPMIDDEIEQAVKKVFFSKAKELAIKIIEVNGTKDHVHLLIQSNPSIAPADIVKHLKGSSSHFINHVTLKDDRIRNLYWQDGYGVISVSPAAIQSIRKYIQNQKEHHLKNQLRKEFEPMA